jgi:hypothetical protein
MSGWSERDLARIGAADEILVAPDQGDRSRGPAVPIWVVRVGDELYVRSYRGASGGWYRRARFQPQRSNPLTRERVSGPIQ